MGGLENTNSDQQNNIETPDTTPITPTNTPHTEITSSALQATVI